MAMLKNQMVVQLSDEDWSNMAHLLDDSLVFRSDDVPERTVELPGGDLGDALQITCRYAFEYV